ncbi:carboxylesterase family protein [Parapedobacter luteus]|nr:dienelactone hydrolase family protein [Parapedobacter luteus]
MMLKFVMLVVGLGILGCKQNHDEPSKSGGEPNPVSIDQSIPADIGKYAVKGGYHIPFYEGTTEGNYGYYLFIPTAYQETEKSYPLLVVLHGSGERGSSRNSPETLDLAIVHGPGKLIKEGAWAPEQEFLVVSAQTDARSWAPGTLKAFIDFLLSTHKIDRERVYLTGLSMGAYGIFDYLGEYGNEARIAAAVPICGRGSLRSNYVNNLSGVPIWVFHGENDPDVPVVRAYEIVSAINALNPRVKAKMTLYPSVGHDSWSMTYDGSGMGRENPALDRFDQDIYSWLYQYTKSR